MAALLSLSPADAAARLKSGRAVLIDIREADEYARAHAPGSVSMPLSRLGVTTLPADREAIFICRSGMRTGSNAPRLAASAGGPAFVVDGGLDAWTKAGLPVARDASAPLEMQRQVQIAAGSMALAGVVLGFLVHPGFFGLSGFVGAGLIVAGATGFCGMARLLAVMPWNRAAA